MLTVRNNFTIAEYINWIITLSFCENIIIHLTVTSIKVFRKSENKKDIVPSGTEYPGSFNPILGTLEKDMVSSRIYRYTAILLTSSSRTFCHCKPSVFSYDDSIHDAFSTMLWMYSFYRFLNVPLYGSYQSTLLIVVGWILRLITRTHFLRECLIHTFL